MDINVEFKLNHAQVKDLFDKVITDYKPLYERIVHAVVRNAASKFDAKQLLRSASGLQNAIQDELEVRFKVFHATIVSVQLRQISLPSDIQNSLQSVLNEDLLQEAELKKRTNTLAEFDRSTALQLQQVDQERVVQIEEVVRSISVERATRKESLENIAVLKAQQTVDAETRRRTKAATLEGQLQAARNSRQGKLQNVLNEEEKTKIRNQDKEAIAIADAGIVVTNAKADADRIINDGVGNAFAIEFEKKSQSNLFGYLQSSANMSSSAILRHNHFDSIRESISDSDLYLDYKKVSLFTEAPGNIEEIKQILN